MVLRYCNNIPVVQLNLNCTELVKKVVHDKVLDQRNRQSMVIALIDKAIVLDMLVVDALVLLLMVIARIVHDIVVALVVAVFVVEVVALALVMVAIGDADTVNEIRAFHASWPMHQTSVTSALNDSICQLLHLLQHLDFACSIFKINLKFL